MFREKKNSDTKWLLNRNLHRCRLKKGVNVIQLDNIYRNRKWEETAYNSFYREINECEKIARLMYHDVVRSITKKKIEKIRYSIYFHFSMQFHPRHAWFVLKWENEKRTTTSLKIIQPGINFSSKYSRVYEITALHLKLLTSIISFPITLRCLPM